MDQELKQRLIGASVIIALAVIFIPMLFDGEVEKTGDQKINISIPESGSNQLTVKSFSLEESDQNHASDDDTDEVYIPESQAEMVDNRLVNRPTVPANGLIETGPEINNKKTNEKKNDETAAPVNNDVSTNPKTSTTEPNQNKVKQTDNSKISTEESAGSQTKVDKQKINEAANTAELNHVYRVKLGSFSQPGNAQQVKNKLAQSGIETLVEFAGESKLYRVWSQSLYQEKQAAENYVAAVNRLKLNLGTPKVISVSSEEVKAANASGQLGWVIQLGSFSAKKNALELRNKVKLAGFIAFVDQVNNSQGEARYRVRVGPFNQQQDATKKQQQIQNKLALKGLVKSHELTTLVE